jgi:hypothetical protein
MSRLEDNALGMPAHVFNSLKYTETREEMYARAERDGLTVVSPAAMMPVSSNMTGFMPNRNAAAPQVSDQLLLRAAFYGSYLKLLHAEATVIGMVLDKECDLASMIDAHNIIEVAKQSVVRQYIKVRVK